MENKFTTIRTKKGQFEVFKNDGKFFLKYLEKGKQQSEKVGYMIKKADSFWLQEAFFDHLNVPHYDFRLILTADNDIRKDFFDNLFAACYQIENMINLKGLEKSVICNNHHREFWLRFIKSLRNGVDITTAYIEAGGDLYD